MIAGLRLPIVAAPMFLVSGPEMVIAAARAGIVGAFPTPNCRTAAELDEWMTADRPWGAPDWGSVVVEMHLGATHGGARAETVTRWTNGLARFSERLERVGRMDFPDLDVAVTIWRDMKPPTHLGLGAGDR